MAPKAKYRPRPPIRYPGLCLCSVELNHICPACRRAGKTEPSLSPWVLGEETDDPPAPPPETIEESDGLEDRLRGYGYRRADQDGGDGEERVSPAEDWSETFLEAVRVLFEAEEINGAA